MSQPPKKKIALVMRDWSSSIGGAERFSVNLAKGLVAGGMDVQIWGGAVDRDLGLDDRFHKITYRKKPSSVKVWSFCRGYQKLLQAFNIDVTFGITQVYPVDVYRVGSGIYPNWLRIQNPNLLLRWIHLLTRPVYWANRMIEKRIMTNPRLKKVVVNSKLEKKNLLRFYPVAEEKIEVIYNGVDLDRFHPMRKEDSAVVRAELDTKTDDSVVLFASNNFRRKGLAVLMRAVALLKEGSVVVWVAGRGKEKAFRSLAKQLDMAHRVRFLGEHSDMPRLYGASDCMVLPTQYDSFSNVVLEAMACDIPVITTPNNGAAEAIEPGVNGYIMKHHNDVEGLARLIQEVLRNKPAWQGRPRKRAEAFSPEDSLAKYVDLFQNLG